MARIAGMVLYRGPSALDGAPIVVVATGLGTRRTANRKTGDMVQTWILPDNGADPLRAAGTGADASVCGDCPHRGRVEQGPDGPRNVARSCYVVLAQAPLQVYRSYRLGRYQVPRTPAEVSRAFRGRAVRVGSYGDPAAVPHARAFWSLVLSQASTWTGYTHQWRQPAGQGLQSICMASADSLQDYAEARAAGWRTFRVRSPGQGPLPGQEVDCPAVAGRSACDRCGLCRGTSSGARSVTIVVHGNGTTHYQARGRRLALAGGAQ